MGAKVTILDTSLERLRYLSDVMPANVQTIFSNRHNILEQIATADLVVGGVLIPGAVAPKLIRKGDLKTMRPGSVIVDVAIDQGGCVETIHATTHENPTYVVDDVIHYGVANMPGGVPRTSTLALTNATFPYALTLANKGWKKALAESPALLKGLNVVDGKVTYRGVAEAFGMEFHEPACSSSSARDGECGSPDGRGAARAGSGEIQRRGASSSGEDGDRQRTREVASTLPASPLAARACPSTPRSPLDSHLALASPIYFCASCSAPAAPVDFTLFANSTPQSHPEPLASRVNARVHT